MEGQTVSHYHILEKIGAGGMGEVYLAEDTSLERKVALKFLPQDLQTDDLAHKRFLREAKSAAAIEHPYICNIKEVAQTDDGQDFIVMEYVDETVCVKNLAEDGFVSTRNLIELVVQLQAGNVPDAVILFGGVNDLCSAYETGQAGLHVRFRQSFLRRFRRSRR